MNKKLTYLIISIIFLGWGSANALEQLEWVSKNGMRVSFYPTSEVAMLDVRLAFQAGSAYDKQAFGLSALTASLIGDGCKGMNADAIAERYEDVGAQFSASTDRDMSVFSLRSLSDPSALQQGVDMFINAIATATFSKSDFTREKRRLLSSIAQSQESPSQVGSDLFYEKLYQNHPYAHPISGTKSSINALNRAQVEAFYHQYYVAQNATLVLVGDITLEKAKQISEQLSQALPLGKKAAKIPAAKALTSAAKVDKRFPSSQASIRLGEIGINYQNKDYFSLVVGNYMLGGGALVSRLAIEVREKRGLTYGIQSAFKPLFAKGPFVIGLATKSSQAGTALKVTKDVLQHYLNAGPSEADLTAAKQYLGGSFPLELASNNQIANILLRMAFYNLPRSYLNNYIKNINAVSVLDITTAMRGHIHPAKMLLVQVG